MRIIYFTFIIYFSTVASELGFEYLDNGFNKENQDQAKVSVSEIDEVKAQELFMLFKSNKSIPFGYPIDGCYARATAMALMAEKHGVTMGKIYAEGFLQVKTDNPNYPLVRWGWHVAPVAYVKGKNGDVTLTVFDPSLFPGPVSEADWLNKMLYSNTDSYKQLRSPGYSKVYYGSRFQYSPRRFEESKSQWQKENLDDAIKTMAEYKIYEENSNSKKTQSPLILDLGLKKGSK